MRITTDDGVELFVAEDGAPDAPPVLLLHGITMSTATWGWLVPDLAGDHRVLRLDFRGHGRSGRAPGTYRPAGYLADAVAACQQLVDGPVPVIGHSLVGLTAAGLAQHHPDLVTGILVEDPPLLPRPTGDAHALDESSLLALFGLLRQAIPQMQASSPDPADLAAFFATTRTTDGRQADAVYHPDTFTTWAVSQLALDVTVLDPVLAGESDAPWDPASPIPTPVTVLAGDPGSPETLMRPGPLAALEASTPQAVVQVVEGAGHNIHDELEGRDVVREAVLAFLRA